MRSWISSRNCLNNMISHFGLQEMAATNPISMQSKPAVRRGRREVPTITEPQTWYKPQIEWYM